MLGECDMFLYFVKLCSERRTHRIVLRVNRLVGKREIEFLESDSLGDPAESLEGRLDRELRGNPDLESLDVVRSVDRPHTVREAAETPLGIRNPDYAGLAQLITYPVPRGDIQYM